MKVTSNIFLPFLLPLTTFHFSHSSCPFFSFILPLSNFYLYLRTVEAENVDSLAGQLAQFVFTMPDSKQ